MTKAVYIYMIWGAGSVFHLSDGQMSMKESGMCAYLVIDLNLGIINIVACHLPRAPSYSGVRTWVEY